MDYNIFNDPYVSECVHEAERTRTISPISAIGEKRIYAESIRKGYVDFFLLIGNVPKETQYTQKNMNNLAQDIFDAPVIFIQDEMIPVLSSLQWKIKESYDKYQDLVQKPWPFKTMWQSSPSGFKMNFIDMDSGILKDKKETMEVDAFFIWNFEKILKEDNFHSIMIGFRTDETDGRTKAYLTPLLNFSADALAIFLEEKICRLDTVKAPNWLRKKADKKNVPKSLVHVLSLRSYENSSKKSNNNNLDGLSIREYVHQWFVRGHLRNQYFPARDSHELIWIDPYRKGPEDKPFIEQVRHVIR